MPIVNSYQMDPTALADLMQAGGYAQAAAEREQRTYARYAQAKREADNRAWQEHMMDKKAQIDQEQMVLRTRLNAIQGIIQNKQRMEYDKARMGLQAPENAKDRALRLEMHRQQLEAAAERQMQELEARKQMEEMREQLKVENYKKLSSYKRNLMAQDERERDRKIAKIQSSNLSDRDKRRAIWSVEADFERRWGHVKKPPEKQAVEEEFNANVVKNEYGTWQRKPDGTFEYMPTKEERAREAKLKEYQIQSRAYMDDKKQRASWIDKYMSKPRLVNGQQVYPSLAEALEAANKIFGPPQKPPQYPGAQPQEEGGKGRDEEAPQGQELERQLDDVLGKLYDPNVSKEERQQAQEKRNALVRNLFKRAAAGDQGAIRVAREFRIREKQLQQRAQQAKGQAQKQVSERKVPERILPWNQALQYGG